MRKLLFLLLFVLGGVAFALTVGSSAADASLLPGLGQDQSATNTNSTSQDAGADASTKQANVNLPVSILSLGSNNGDVDQSNEADTKAYADNSNGTDQSVEQDQQAKVDGSRGTSHDKGSGTGIDQSQSAGNDNSTEQGAEATAGTSQLNVNAPISVLSWGANNGDVDQHNDATTTAGASNGNATLQSVDQGQRAASGGSGAGGGVEQSQEGWNSNETTQQAAAEATTEQANVNLPISILSWGSNNGDVDQSNKADTKAYADNSNGTAQSVDQGQQAWVAGDTGHGDKGYGHKGQHGPAIVQDQTAGNDNSTEQWADASATTKQANLNAPISILSWGGGGCGCGKSDGDVDQSNHADTKAYATNDNVTYQTVDQAQDAFARGFGFGRIDQSQSAGNSNRTEQGAEANARTKQANVNVPISVLSWGANNGDVEQGNQARTVAGASNSNATLQSVDQTQQAKAEGVRRPHKPERPHQPDHCGCQAHHPKPHHPRPQHPSKPDHCGCKPHHPVKPVPVITQTQDASNRNDTTQNAYADAVTEQKNVNFPISFFSFGGDGGHDCGCKKHGGGHGDGVRQRNDAETKAYATNDNLTLQSIRQWQEALIGRR
jgi:hypothetical protein